MAAADKMRGHMDSGEDKHVVLGLIFLKYISDAFEARRQTLTAELAEQMAEGENFNRAAAPTALLTPLSSNWIGDQATAAVCV